MKKTTFLKTGIFAIAAVGFCVLGSRAQEQAGFATLRGRTNNYAQRTQGAQKASPPQTGTAVQTVSFAKGSSSIGCGESVGMSAVAGACGLSGGCGSSGGCGGCSTGVPFPTNCGAAMQSGGGCGTSSCGSASCGSGSCGTTSWGSASCGSGACSSGACGSASFGSARGGLFKAGTARLGGGSMFGGRNRTANNCNPRRMRNSGYGNGYSRRMASLLRGGGCGGNSASAGACGGTGVSSNSFWGRSSSTYQARNAQLSQHLFGWLIPSGNGGMGSPPFGKYHVTYAQDANYFDQRDGGVYGAQGYGTHVTVPLAPNVRHAYNYGWGLPSSRITRISNVAPYTTLRPLHW